MYFKEKAHLVVVCYLRQGYDSTRTRVWEYEVVVKGQSREGHLIHYILARKIYHDFTLKKPEQVSMIIRHAIREARTCGDAVIRKMQDDSKLLKDTYDLINKDDIKDGKRTN